MYKQRVDPLLRPITGEENTWKLVVPVEYQDRVLRNAHCEMTAGHLGVEKKYERIAQDIYIILLTGGLTTSLYRDVTSVKGTSLAKRRQRGEWGVELSRAHGLSWPQIL